VVQKGKDGHVECFERGVGREKGGRFPSCLRREKKESDTHFARSIISEKGVDHTKRRKSGLDDEPRQKGSEEKKGTFSTILRKGELHRVFSSGRKALWGGRAKGHRGGWERGERRRES